MKRFLVLILVAILIAPTIYAGDALEVIWQKNIWQQYTVEQAVFSKDGQWIYAAAGNHIYKIDVNTGEKVSEFNTGGALDPSTKGAIKLSLSPDGMQLLTLNYPELYLWDTETETFLESYELPISKKDYIIKGFEFTKDNNLLLAILKIEQNGDVFTYFEELILTNYETHEIIRSKELPNSNYSEEIEYIVAGHQSNLIALKLLMRENGVSKTNKIVLWDLETFEEIQTLETLPYDYNKKKLQFSEDDRYLGIFKQWDLHVYDLQDYSLVFNKGAGSFEFLNENILYYRDYNNPEGFKTYLYDFSKKENKNTIELLFGADDFIKHTKDDINIKIFAAQPIYIGLLNFDTSVSVDEIGTSGTIQIAQIENNIIISSTTEILKEISITDINGNSVYSVSNINSTNTSIQNDFPSGIYFVLIKTDKNEFVEKIMVVR